MLFQDSWIYPRRKCLWLVQAKSLDIPWETLVVYVSSCFNQHVFIQNNKKQKHLVDLDEFNFKVQGSLGRNETGVTTLTISIIMSTDQSSLLTNRQLSDTYQDDNGIRYSILHALQIDILLPSSQPLMT